jgi:rhodanese-related sulfurtransferase
MTAGETAPVASGAVSAAEAMTFAANGGLLLDVREDHEWEAGHAPDARHIPMSQLGDRIGELSADESMLVICHSGARSQQVTTALNDAGYSALNVVGGMVAWQLAGGAVTESGSQPSQA